MTFVFTLLYTALWTFDQWEDWQSLFQAYSCHWWCQWRKFRDLTRGSSNYHQQCPCCHPFSCIPGLQSTTPNNCQHQLTRHTLRYGVVWRDEESSSHGAHLQCLCQCLFTRNGRETLPTSDGCGNVDRVSWEINGCGVGGNAFEVTVWQLFKSGQIVTNFLLQVFWKIIQTRTP